MIDWFDENVVLHYAQPQTLTVPYDEKFHVGPYEYKHLWLLLYQWVPSCMHFSLWDEDTRERNKDHEIVTCPMAHCGIGRNLPPSTFQFPFPEGEFGMAIYDCCQNWEFPRPSPRDAMKVVKETGATYIYSMWKQHHVHVLAWSRELPHSKSRLAVMVHAMVDEFMKQYYSYIQQGATFSHDYVDGQLRQLYNPQPIDLTGEDVQDIECENNVQMY